MEILNIFLVVTPSVYFLVANLIFWIGYMESKFRKKPLKAYLFLVFLWPLYLYILSITDVNYKHPIENAK